MEVGGILRTLPLGSELLTPALAVAVRTVDSDFARAKPHVPGALDLETPAPDTPLRTTRK
ncbi:hypothetical protein GCM10025774_15840 [Microbacterium kyungheense]